MNVEAIEPVFFLIIMVNPINCMATTNADLYLHLNNFILLVAHKKHDKIT